jgi:hypothetical protein
MCFSDLLSELGKRGIRVTESQIRWAIRSGKTSRPPLDGSLRFAFTGRHVDEFEDHFRKTSPRTTEV